MEFRVLGRPEVCQDGECLDSGTLKQRTVLAALLLSANEPLSTARLVDSVWWDPPAAAGSNLRMYLSGLRRLLRVPGEQGSRLRTPWTGVYELTVLPGELDLDRFYGLADRGGRELRDGRPRAAADSFEQALRLWRGRALDGLACGPGLQTKVMLVEERRLAVAEQWAHAWLDLGRPERVVPELRALVKEHPLRERLWGCLILALCRSGRPGEALAAYAELRGVLAAELGTDPGPELRRLHERILRGDGSLADARPVPADGPLSIDLLATGLRALADGCEALGEHSAARHARHAAGDLLRRTGEPSLALPG
ncbi:AfsR/SARP family transcriptional regulator [Phytohabitans sp. ZYX-F-186]|uniref:AfsR/SARP family transcriptional regulator n=1 Tax=Phytohabitans maris TaxID=3071409 RepID=A0ABU0ZQR1_9ACTN|nr:AfsR/SARP family transcriptional regulator [Phytohabitans sp. ZYX-F-186]MDQ7908257.1 AfsR/SARP family transcriptional regulator [Phytohabitans sp. ZYX-F-186]